MRVDHSNPSGRWFDDAAVRTGAKFAIRRALSCRVVEIRLPDSKAVPKPQRNNRHNMLK
jgi:hypothetical protein